MTALIVVIIIVVIGLIVFGAIRNTPEHKGKEGELHVHNTLAQLPPDYTILDDVVLKTNSGTTQIDHVVVSRYGVFAIETKNYRGDIYGNDDRQQWTQVIVTDVTYMKKWYKTYTYVTKNRFYNPVKQSVSHANAIKRTLSAWSNLKVVPIVVFAGSAVLKNVTTQHHVVYDDQLLATIRSYSYPCLSEADVAQVVNRLTQQNVRDQVDDRTHVGNVYAAKYKTDSKIASGICPQCGGTLVLRHGRYGNFYGCSNYPRCRFTTQ